MFIGITVIIFGCIIGSFLTVCIYRIPFASLAEESEVDVAAEIPEETKKEGLESIPETIKSPFENLTINNPKRSFCPHCLHKLSWYHNIPVLSWLFLMGRCKFCKKEIPARYPLVELSTGLLAYLSFANFGLNPSGFVIFAFCCALLVIMVIDYDHYIIPNVISLPGTALGFITASINSIYPIFNFPIVSGVSDALFGVLAGAGSLLLVSEFYIRVRKMEGLGMGDVKLLAMIGAFFGIQCSFYTIVIGSLFGAIFGLTLILLKGRKMSEPLPFGPYLASATLIYIFGGPQILENTILGISSLLSF